MLTPRSVDTIIFAEDVCGLSFIASEVVQQHVCKREVLDSIALQQWRIITRWTPRCAVVVGTVERRALLDYTRRQEKEWCWIDNAESKRMNGRMCL